MIGRRPRSRLPVAWLVPARQPTSTKQRMAAEKNFVATDIEPRVIPRGRQARESRHCRTTSGRRVALSIHRATLATIALARRPIDCANGALYRRACLRAAKVLEVTRI